MIGLFDRDVFVKLGCCNLWTEAVAALGVTQPYRLPSTNSARSNVKLVTRLLGEVDTAEAIVRVAGMVADVPVLSDELVDGIEASAAFQQLANIDDIDAGEQLLGAVLLNDPEHRILVSGDKRFVKALRSQLPDQWDAVSGAVISLEMCLMAIEERFGFEFLLERVVGVKHCDGTLRMAIGAEPTREAFLEAMRSFNPCRAEEPAAEIVVVLVD